jgi:hypothetical protein
MVAVSLAEWCREERGAVQLTRPRGKLVQRLGYSRPGDGRQYLHLEEAAWLLGRGRLRLAGRQPGTSSEGEDEEEKAGGADSGSQSGTRGGTSTGSSGRAEVAGGGGDSVAAHATVVSALLSSGYRMEVYRVYTMLSDMGCVVRTRPAPTADDPGGCAGGSKDGEGRAPKRQRTAAPSSQPAGAPEPPPPTRAAPHAALGPGAAHLDVWPASAMGFSRSSPGAPSFVVCVCNPAQVCPA